MVTSGVFIVLVVFSSSGVFIVLVVFSSSGVLNVTPNALRVPVQTVQYMNTWGVY